MPEKPENNAILSLVAALGVAQALEKITGLKIGVKWPNDVLCIRKDGHALKIGGILCEGRGPKVVVGIGINLNQSAEDLPSRLLFEASSLQIETGREWDIETVLNAILAELERVLAVSWSDLHRDFARHCYGLGDVVRVKGQTSSVIGLFEAIGEDGALLLRTPDGVQHILAGDISYF